MTDRKPTRAQLAALESVEHITLHSNGVYQFASTGRHMPLAIAKRCEENGWLEGGYCVSVDGDGCLPNGKEKYGLGFKLTPAGLAVLKVAHAPHEERQALINRLWDSRDEAIKQRDELQLEVEQMRGSRVLTCVYCGHEYPQDTPAAGAEVLTAHIAVCERHPMRVLLEMLRESGTELEKFGIVTHLSSRLQVWLRGGIVDLNVPARF